MQPYSDLIFKLTSNEKSQLLDVAWLKIETLLGSLLKGSDDVSLLSEALESFREYHESTTVETQNNKYRHLDLELLSRFEKYVCDYLQQLWKDFGKSSHDACVRFYVQQWHTYEASSLLLIASFYLLEKELSKWWKVKDPLDQVVSLIESRLLLWWNESVLANIKTDLQEALLGLIQTQRNLTRTEQLSNKSLIVAEPDIPPQSGQNLKHADRASLIKSALESFISSQPDKNLARDIGSVCGIFKDVLVEATSKYYTTEKQALVNGLQISVVGYLHRFLNRMSVEREFLPDSSDKKILLEPMLKAFHNAYVTPMLESDLTSYDKGGGEATLSEVAGSKKYDDMVLFLIHDRNGLDRKDSLGHTVLHCAVISNNLTLVNWLLKSGARSDAQDYDGRTAGHLAVLTGNIGLLKSLSSQPAGFSVKDKYGRTIRDCLVQLKPHDDSWEEPLETALRLEETAWLFDEPLEDESIQHAFKPTLVGYKSGFFEFAEETSNLKEVLGKDFYYQTYMNKATGLKWLHLPGNNMRWVELLMLRYSNHKSQEKILDRNKILSEQLWKSYLHTGSKNLVHARYMRPMCQKIGASSDGSFVLMMPYIHWEYADTFASFSGYARVITDPSIDVRDKNRVGENMTNEQKQLIEMYMQPNPEKDSRHPARQLHIRRSLDQYCYHALPSTKRRDKNQLVSRMFDEKRPNPLKGRPVMIVVDQLWLWVLGNDTVFTSFSGRWSKDQPKDIKPDTTDVLENIKRDRTEVHTQHELASRVVYNCLTSCLDPGTNLSENLQFLEFYDTEISRLADEEATLFQKFSKKISEEQQDDTRKGKRALESLMKAIGISQEIQLLEQIKDIQDELHTLGVLIGHQKAVVDQLCRFDPSSKNSGLSTKTNTSSKPDPSTRPNSSLKAKKMVNYYDTQVKDMSKHAKLTYQALSRLIDLKQKYANVQEARSARAQSEETTRQGKTLMVFTIVTIVFLPLSFLATFFALQIQEFPWIDGPDGSDSRLSLTWVSKYIFPISVAVSLLFVWLAFEIDIISDYVKPFTGCLGFFQEVQKKRDNETTPPTAKDAQAPGSGSPFRDLGHMENGNVATGAQPPPTSQSGQTNRRNIS